MPWLVGLRDRALIAVMVYTITAYLEAGGTLENAQAMAAHEIERDLVASPIVEPCLMEPVLNQVVAELRAKLA